MSDNGDTKDDVKVPEGEIGDKINKLFREDEKDTSQFPPVVTAEKMLKNPDVIVLTSMGEEVAIEAKEAPKG